MLVVNLSVIVIVVNFVSVSVILKIRMIGICIIIINVNLIVTKVLRTINMIYPI